MRHPSDHFNEEYVSTFDVAVNDVVFVQTF